MGNEELKAEYEAEIKRLRLIMDISKHINSQPTLSDTARVIVEILKEIGFDRAGVWICNPNEDSIHGIWGTDGNGNIHKSKNNTLPISSIPPDHGYTVEMDPLVLKGKLGVDCDYVFLFKDLEDYKFEMIWGYHPPSPGFYRRNENGDNICICVKNGDKKIGMIAVDNYITKRKIDETSANLFSIIGAEMAKAVANMALRESLAAEKEKLAVTLESIGDGVIATDVHGNIVLMNAVSEKLTGWAEEESLGKPLNEIFHIVSERSGKEIIENPIEKILKTGELAGFSNSTILIAKDGSERLISDSGAPVRDREGNMIGAVLVFQDVTEKRRIEEELIKAQKLDSVGILAGGIAHDFNNILTGILGNISLAKMYLNPDDRVFDRLADAERASMEAKNLTQKLLTFSSGGAPILKLASIKDILIDSTNFALKGSNVKCKFDIPDDLCSIEIDEGQISQVINNIVINASQAMPNGGIIEVGAENVEITAKDNLPLKSGKYIKIHIKDYGIGIPKEHIRRIFDPYFTTKQKGNGLGLSTAYSIIRNHYGHIEVGSELEIGTTFYIYLPARIEYHPMELTDNNLRDKLRILVIDDQEIIRDLAQAILGNLGHEIFVAEDGTKAVEFYAFEIKNGRGIDLIIMDLTIPGGMGGKEAIIKLREINSNFRALVSSGYSDDPVISEYESYGFDGFIVKPYKNKELIEAVHNVMLRRR